MKAPTLLTMVVVLLMSCTDGERAGSLLNAESPIESVKETTMLETIEHLDSIQDDRYQKAVVSSIKLNHTAATFLTSPDESTLASLKSSWLDAHRHFLAARFFSFIKTDMQNYQVDAWPIREGFLDHLPDYPQSGLISDITLPINAVTLTTQHGVTDPEEVSLGFHAIEFLLFRRSLEDYSLIGDNVTMRRRQTLKVITQVLVQDIEIMLSQSRSATARFRDVNEELDPMVVDIYIPILNALHERLLLLFLEANDISEISGHSRFSQTSLNNLKTQVAVLNELTGKQTGLYQVFLLLDQNITNNYGITLIETQEILSMDDPGEELKARLPLLLAALGHQLGDLKLILNRSIN
jgi:hypothetical protein